VRTVGPVSGVWGLPLPPHRDWKPDGDIETVWPDWLPDLVIYSKAPPFEFNPRYRGVPHVVHAVDNHLINFRHQGIAHYFLAHTQGQAMPIEGPQDTWLPCAYDPVFFTPSPIPWAARRFDVTLVGVMYPQRLEMVQAMGAAGFKVLAGIGAVYEEFRDIYHNTRISLCPSAHGDVALRVFETAAMKCLLLCDPCPDFPFLGIDGVVIYNSIPDAIAKVRMMLDNPALAESMIQRSYAWAKPHTWDARAAAVLQWLASYPSGAS